MATRGISVPSWPLAGCVPGHACDVTPHLILRAPLLLGQAATSHFHISLQHLTPDRIYHVTVMPCYDKKLEASRPDFFSQDYQTRDVDCVVTTGVGPT